jgi:large subunit ribosomal protein L4
MEATLYNQAGDQIGTIQINEYIFGIEPNTAVMHQAMVRQLANARKGTHNTLNRGEVRGSTRKLYRQKGTGRARQGAIRAPHRRGGGIAHGPHPRSYEKHMPRKMRRLAVRSALSVRQAGGQIRFVEGLGFAKPRTKDMIAMLDAQGLEGKTLIVLDNKDEYVYRSASNLPYVKTLLANYLNVVDLLSHDNIILPIEAVRVIEGYLGNGASDIVVTKGAQPAAGQGSTTRESVPATEPPAGRAGTLSESAPATEEKPATAPTPEPPAGRGGTVGESGPAVEKKPAPPATEPPKGRAGTLSESAPAAEEQSAEPEPPTEPPAGRGGTVSESAPATEKKPRGGQSADSQRTSNPDEEEA